MEKATNLNTKGSSKREGGAKNKPSKNLRKKINVRLSKLKFEEKIVEVKRVTKVVKGGKKITFRVVVIIGDKKNRVGVGVGRAEDVNLAIDKAILSGKKNLVTIPLTRSYSIPHVIYSSMGSTSIMLRPAGQGTGVIAGGSIRTVLELGGVRNILAKQIGSSNILNNAKTTILAVKLLNDKIELSKYQSVRQQSFYEKIMKKYKNVRISN